MRCLTVFAALLWFPGAMSAQTPERPVSWKLLVPNLLSDQEKIWTFPARLAEGKDWISTSAIMATTAGLIAVDPAEAGWFRSTGTFQGFNSVFTGKATALGTVAAPVSFYIAGLVRHDAKMQRTALLAGEAVGDVEILATALKAVTKRVRPADFAKGSRLSDSWFEGGSVFRTSGSFPSGHAIAAFAVATVIARRYGNHKWVPYAAYGAAALIGFSRLSLSAHFLSDVFVGGALGYSVARFTVLRAEP